MNDIDIKLICSGILIGVGATVVIAWIIISSVAMANNRNELLRIRKLCYELYRKAIQDDSARTVKDDTDNSK